MSVFNPKMLDASIRDVVASLSSNDKTNVLLYAMEHLPMKAEYVFNRRRRSRRRSRAFLKISNGDRERGPVLPADVIDVSEQGDAGPTVTGQG